MFKKRNIGIIFIAAIALFFSYIYSTSVSKLATTNYVKEDTSSVDVQNPVNQSEQSIKISKDTKLIFRTKDKKSKKIISEEIKEPDDLIGKTKKELEEIFKDQRYLVEKMTKEEVILVKENYTANKYILGIDNGLIVIFKTDANGVESIEEITDKKISMLHEEDIILLRNGELEFQTLEEAEESLADYE